MKDAAYYRAYRAKRRAAGTPLPSGGKHDAADYALYRRKRALQGSPIPSRAIARGWGEFVAWDGEGFSDGPERIGLTRTEWDARVRDLAARYLDDRQAIEEPFWSALGARRRIVVDAVLESGRYRRAGEFADLPRHLIAMPKRLGPEIRFLPGNLDQLCALAGVQRGEELIDFFVAHPRRTTWAMALDYARHELRDLRGQPRPHRYALLANSHGDYIEHDSLSTKTCLDFLLAGAKAHPKARHVWFGSGYDSTMILRDLPREAILAIVGNQSRSPIHVRYASGEWSLDDGKAPRGVVYAIHLVNRKTLRIAKFLPGKKFERVGAKNVPRYESSISLWDVFGFFQQRFTDALRDYRIEAALEAMQAMKEKRAHFTDADASDIRAYCIGECKALADLMHTLFAHFWRIGIRPSRLDGAGAGAAAFLKAERVKDHIAREPEHLARPIACAFFGGRIELARIGHVNGPVYGADISSAYPHAASTLPALVGEWKHGPGRFALHHIRYRFPTGQRFYPLPYRNPSGSIVFAPTGEGWYWACEVDAARQYLHTLGGTIDVLESWHLEPATDHLPFARVPHFFAERQTMKRQNDGAQLAVKLILNSIYGKTAQQIGGSYEKLPPFFALPWAGWITAQTRARLVYAALHDPEAVIMFATDGIYSSRPLALDYHDGALVELGGWESARYDNGVFAQAGVYWTRDGATWKARYRGFNRDAMQTPNIALKTWDLDMPSVPIPVTRFVTFGSALQSPDLWEYRGTWRTANRTLDLTGESPKRSGTKNLVACGWALVDLAPKTNTWYETSCECSRAYDSITLPDDRIDGVSASEFDAEVTEG